MDDASDVSVTEVKIKRDFVVIFLGGLFWSSRRSETLGKNEAMTLDNSSNLCKVLSLGIAYAFEIDDYFLGLGCTVWSSDPSMKKGPDYKRGPNHEFFHVGLSPQ